MNNQLLSQYKLLIEFLGEALGPDYEFTLHDLKDHSNSLVAISNNHISGREVGAPLTNKALQLMADQAYKDQDYVLHYKGLSTGNKTLRSSTLFIKDSHGRPIGLLCVNFDDSRYSNVCNEILKLCHPDQFLEHNAIPGFPNIIQTPPEERQEVEVFPNSINSVMENIVNQVMNQCTIPPNRMTQEDKMQIIDMLDKKGIFMLKGAVSYVAAKLCSSEASIYRYLGKLAK